MRSLVLLVVVAFAFSLVVPTVRSFLAQRAEVAALERDVAAARARNADLEAELLRWDDPAYVAAQARERLAYVLPGEVAYRVVDPEVVDTTPDVDDAAEPETPSSGVLVPASDVPWFESIWESVQVAGAAGASTQPGDAADDASASGDAVEDQDAAVEDQDGAAGEGDTAQDDGATEEDS